MRVEIKAERSRVYSNYARLFASLLVGLLITRLLLGEGNALFGIYTTITVGMGLSVMLTELLRMGFVPELGPHVSNGAVIDRKQFGEGLLVAFVISLGAAAVGAFFMLLLGLWLLPTETTPELYQASWSFLWIRIVMMLFVVTLTPALTIFLVSSRHSVFNLVMFLEKLSELIGILIPIWLLTDYPVDQADRLVQIGLYVSIFTVFTHLCAAGYAFALSSEFRPAWRVLCRTKLNSIMKRIGWSSLQTISMNLYVRADVLIVAAYSGPIGVVALGVALRLMGYVRQATMGLVSGLDAVFANLSGQQKVEKDGSAVAFRLIYTSTALQASVLFQLLVLLLFLGSNIVEFWIGDVLTGVDRAKSVSEITTLSALLVVGISFRSLSLGWMSAMTGSGNARHFTPWLLPGAAVNVLTLTTWALVSPDTFSVIVVGWVFLVLQVLTHGVLLPVVSSRSLGISLGDLSRPLAVPFLVALVSFFLCSGWYELSEEGTGYLRAVGVVVIVVFGLALGLAYTVTSHVKVPIEG